jgi:hypothetical protein
MNHKRRKLTCSIAFVNILNEMRLGRLSQSAIDIFKSLARKPAGNDEIEPTEL